MGGKNQRRKAALIVTGICAVIFAVVALAFCFNDFSVLRRGENDTGTYAIDVGNETTNDSAGTYNYHFNNGVAGEQPVYYVEFAGANGGCKGQVASYGATVFGFFKGNDLNDCKIGGYGGNALWYGGKRTQVYLNFLTNAAGEGWSYAAGGGGDAKITTSTVTVEGEEVYFGSSSTKYRRALTINTKCTATVGSFNDGGWARGGSGDGGIASIYGSGASQSGNGAAGSRSDIANDVNDQYGMGGQGYYSGGDGGIVHYLHDNYRLGSYVGYNGGEYYQNTPSGSGHDKRYCFYRYGSGGGGSSSPNSFPKYGIDTNNQRSTDAGFIKLVRLNPTRYPSDAFGKLGAQNGISSGTTVSHTLLSESGVQTRYQYYVNDTWSNDEPKFSTTGSHTVQWRYVVTVAGKTGVIHSGTSRVVVESAGQAGSYADGYFNNRPYTGEAQQLITSAPNGASSGATMNYAIASTSYSTYSGDGSGNRESESVAKTSDSLTWVNDYNQLFKPTDVGTYYLYWYASARGPSGGQAGNTESKVAWAKVSITKTKPTLGVNSLRGTNPVYNGSPQSMFTGRPSVLVPNNRKTGNNDVYDNATLLYALSNSLVTRPSTDENKNNDTVNGNLAALKRTDVDGKPYYLWVKGIENNNLSATEWVCLGETTKSQMQTATIAVTGLSILNPATREYNGQSTPFVEGTPQTDRGAALPLTKEDVGEVTYHRYFTSADELAKQAQNADYEPKVEVLTANNLAEVNLAKDAGLYELVVAWSGSNPDKAFNIYPGETHFQYYTIKKATHGINLGSSLQMVYNPTISVDGAPLVTAGWFECILDGNAVTAPNDVIDGSENWVSFCWTRDGVNPPALDDPQFAINQPLGAPLGTHEMQLLYDYRARLSGTWWLWLRFDHHRNIASDTIVRYGYSVTVNDLPATDVTLENVNGGLRHNDDLPFDGQLHEIATGDFLYAETFIQIDERDVEYNIADGNGNLVGGYTDSNGEEHDGWTKNKADLRVATFGNYYLVVRWGYTTDENGQPYYHENVAATDVNGIRLYSKTLGFQITTKTDFSDLTFTGLPVNPLTGTYYDNTARLYTEAAPSKLEFYINGQQVKQEYKEFFDGLDNSLDGLNFALTTSDEVRPDVNAWYADIPTATNVGQYYLWIKWNGDGRNIAPSYRAYNLTEYLSITQAPQPNVKIDNIAPLSEADRTYAEHAIPLFGFADGSDTPILLVQNMTGTAEDGSTIYNQFNLLKGAIHYALTDHNDAAPLPGDKAWCSSLTEARQTKVRWLENGDRGNPDNVAEYYLWVMISDDQNIVDSTYLIGGTKLELQEAYVEQAPTAKPGLSYIQGTFQVLINGSPQDVAARAGIKPPVEYLLYRSGETDLANDWVRDRDEDAKENGGKGNLKDTIGAISSGTYYVFYRGGHDDNHVTQKENRDLYVNDQGIGYPYVVVQITPASASISLVPATMNTVYNGKPQTFFQKGYGKIAGNDRLELRYAIFNQPLEATALDALIAQTEQTEDDRTKLATMDYYDKLNWYLEKSNSFADYVETERLMRTNAGTYTIYYKAENHPDIGANPVQSTQIAIARTAITPKRLDFLETSADPNIVDLYKQYKADDYRLVLSELVFGLNNTDNLDNLSGKIGTPGVVEYGVAKFDPLTMAMIPEPTTAVTDYLSLTARDAGVYYLYYRVWAGDNHLGTGNAELGVEPSWVCFNEAYPVYISQADSSVVELSWSTDNFGPTVRYNGQQRAVVTEGELVQKIEGRTITDPVGRIWYALTASPNSPGANSVAWKNSYLSATQDTAGEYYLHVKVEASANLTQLIGCVNLHNPVILGKATADDLSISGITVYNQMYNGGPLNLAVGELQVNTINVDSRGQKNIITANVLPGVAGFYQYTTYKNRKPLTNWPKEQGLAAATNAVEAGEYYLWVKLPASDNTEEAIVLVNDTPVEITLANEENIYIVTPTLSSAVEYNGRDHNLVIGEAGLALRSGNALTGIRGNAWYMVKQDSTLPSENASGWTQRYDAVVARERGVYYVFVKFTANGSSCNHTDLKPVLAGQVEITRTGVNTLLLSGIYYEDDRTYNGANHQIANGELELKIDLGGELVTATGAGIIRYAWSNNRSLMPSISDAEWVTDLSQLTAVNAGEYYLWVWVGGGDNIDSFRTCLANDDHDPSRQYMLIKQATADVVKLSGIGPYSDHLVYTGAPQQLAKGTLVQKIAGNEVTSGYIAYGLGFGPNKGQQPEVWYSSLELVMATEATTNGEKYYLWVRIDESANIAAQTAYLCGISIDRAQAVVTGIEGASNLYYYQGEQRLLTSPGTANFGEVVYRLSDGGNVHDANDWLSDWREVVGQDAGWYTVYYAVIDNPNWAYYSAHMAVYIQPSRAPFADKPSAKTYLVYNEKPQDLIEFGALVPEAGAQGCRIRFRYADEDPNIWYEYYDANTTDNEAEINYTWSLPLGKLPGRTDTGSYEILYYTTGGTTGNYLDESAQTDFIPHSLTVEIKRREIIWLSRPTPRYGLKNIDEAQVLLESGLLSAPNVLGGTIEYTMDKDDPKSWRTDLPQGKGEQIFYCWYRVHFDATNNYFLDGDIVYGEDPSAGIVYTEPQVLQVLMEKLTLSFRSEPQGVVITYDATNQPLVTGGELSTFDMEGVKNVFVNYSFDGQNWLGQDTTTNQSVIPTASRMGKYTIYYRVEFNQEVFEWTGDIPQTGVLESTVVSAVIEGNEIRAVIEIDEENNYQIGFEKGKYSDDFGMELAEVIEYRFRRRDAYFTDDAWHPWSEFDKEKIGKYEIQAIIDAKDETNFTAYEQTENFDTFTIAKDLTVNIDVRARSEHPQLRIWVDLTGAMSYGESPFRTEYNPLDKDSVTLHGVNSPGKGGQGTIRVQCYNNRYYYLSETLVSEYQMSGKDSDLVLSAANVDKAVLTLNPGLDATKPTGYYTAYIYEVYKITYDANTGMGSLPEGWKWHDVAYELTENNFEKAGLVADGWSRYPSGSGERYRKGAMYYKDNLSQIFYAQYAGENERTVIIRWQVGDYEYSSTGVWFDAAAEPERPKGMTYVKNAQVYLPDISGLPDTVTNGERIIGWHMEPPDESVHYSWGFVANREEIVFVAELNKRGEDYLNIVFTSEGVPVHNVTIANGSDSYMALSGLTAVDFKRYNYQKFIEEYQYEKLKVSDGERTLTYELGAALSSPEEPPDIQNPAEKPVSGEDGGTGTMVILIIIGMIIAIIALVVYMMVRNKKVKMKVKRLKEDKSV